jgi:competence ComEA-like helix-hairpin-helix protein
MSRELRLWQARRIFLVVACLLAVFAGSSGAADKKQPPARPVNINLATVKELQELPGVGLVTAKAIVQFRQKSGPFHRVEDLLAVRGISEGKLDKMRPFVVVTQAVATPRAASPKPAAKPQ